MRKQRMSLQEKREWRAFRKECDRLGKELEKEVISDRWVTLGWYGSMHSAKVAQYLYLQANPGKVYNFSIVQHGESMVKIEAQVPNGVKALRKHIKTKKMQVLN